MSKNMIITIGREFGSGGHEIGEKLAQKLGIEFYDKNLIELAANRSGLDSKVVSSSDEKAPGFFVSPYSPTISDKLFFAQSELIRHLADTQSFVIVGRCANALLRGYADTLDVFIFAPLEDRIKRVSERYILDTPEKARKEINRIDKIRRGYYQYYTEYHWGGRDGHDLIIDSTMLGIDGTVDLLEEIARKRFAE